MFTRSAPLPSKKALTTAQKVIDLMKDIPVKARKSLTLDNGGEFACHEQWHAQLSLPSFFCDPYASWQKGGVENTNGRLRRDMPRKTDIRHMSQEAFDENIDIITRHLENPSPGYHLSRPLSKIYKGLHFKLECGTPS